MTPTPAQIAVDAVRRELGGNHLIWLGIRGQDAEPLLRFAEFVGSFSLIAPLRSGSLAADMNQSLEQLSGRRIDPDADTVDLAADEHGREFQRRLLKAVSGECVLMTYRPTALASDLAFSMATTMRLAGMFADRNASFDHKPWVETQLRARHVKGLGWTYVAKENRSRVERLVAAEGPQILRTGRKSGGVGIVLVRHHDEIDACWPDGNDTFVGVSRYVETGVPVNLSGCVFRDGTLRVHPASVQLIGVPSCIDRPFGYCGNDFVAAAALPSSVLNALDALAATVGTWLHEERYVGAFGVDALVVEEDVRFVEVNARFQGSSALSAEIALGLDLPDLYLDHLAATLGLQTVSPGLSISEWASCSPPAAHVVVHNTMGCDAIRADEVEMPDVPRDVRLTLLPDDIRIAPGGTLCRLVLSRSVTLDGFALDAATEEMVDAVRARYIPAC